MCLFKDRLKTILHNLGKATKFIAGAHFLNLGVHRYWPHKVKKENNSTSPWLSSEGYSMHCWHADNLAHDVIWTHYVKSTLNRSTCSCVSQLSCMSCKDIKIRGHGNWKKKTHTQKKGYELEVSIVTSESCYDTSGNGLSWKAHILPSHISLDSFSQSILSDFVTFSVHNRRPSLNFWLGCERWPFSGSGWREACPEKFCSCLGLFIVVFKLLLCVPPAPLDVWRNSSHKLWCRYGLCPY